MVSLKIEKEIRQDNKVMFGLTMRQLVSAATAVSAAVIIYFITRLDITIMVIPDCLLAVLAYFIGWREVDGMKAEHYLMKRLKSRVYGNDKRIYRTKNAYITLMNRAYSAKRQADMADKTKAKVIKAAAKKKKQKTGYRIIA